MFRLLALSVFIAVAVPAQAGNARSDRTAQTFQRDHAKRLYLNYQWARHMSLQRQDQQAYRQNPTNPNASKLGARLWRERQNFEAWQRSTAPRPVIRWR